MKSTIVFAVTSLVLAALCLALWSKNRAFEKELATVQFKVMPASEQLGRTDSKMTELKEENSRLRQQLADLQMDLANTQAGSNRIVLAQQAAKNQPGAKGKGKGMTGLLKEMMDDPEMRKGLMQQQKMGMDLVYGPMIKDLGLTSEEADKFKELLINKQMDMMSLTGDGKGGTVTPENQKKITEQQKNLDSSIKDLLGDKGFAQYQDYNETVSERMALNQFTAQNTSVTPDQKDQLLSIIKEEKKRNPDAGSTPADQAIQGLKAMESEDAMEKLMQRQIDLNARVLERSRGVLSQEQVDQLAAFQSNQINMQRIGLKMAAKMMSPDENAIPQTPVVAQPQ